MHRALALTALATLLSPGAVAANDGPPRGGVVLVNPPSLPQATGFASAEDRWYRFTVTGAYLFDGRSGRADCGHKDPADDTPWINEPNFTVDGSLAECVFLPFNQAHTYEWLQRGTGRPFLLDIPDGAYNTSDDVGWLVVAIQDVR